MELLLGFRWLSLRRSMIVNVGEEVVMLRSILNAFFVILATGVISSASSAQTVTDREAVRVLVDDQYRFFDQRQAGPYGELFAPNATFITAEGMKMNGREEIVEGNAFFFSMIDTEKNNVTYKNLIVNFITPDVAVTYSVWDGLWTKPAIGGRAQSGYLTMTVQKLDGRWMIASATNAFNWRGTPNYDLIEYAALREEMKSEAASQRK